MNITTFLKFLKRVFLKYVIRYSYPRRYWDFRWKHNLKVETEKEGRRSYFKTVANIMKQFECSNILEVGCGEAYLRELPNYLGLDFSLEALRKSGLQHFVHADITRKIPLPSKSYDAVLSRAVLIHIAPNKIDVAVQEMCRVAKKVVILFEPCGLSTQKTQPHCFIHNLPKLFKENFEGATVILQQRNVLSRGFPSLFIV